MEISKEQVENINSISNTKQKQRLRPVVLVFFLFIILGSLFLYSQSQASRIKTIKIINNHYLTEDYIKSLLNVNENDSKLFIFPSFKEVKIKKDPLIDNCNISFEKNGVLLVNVKENRIVGYNAVKSDDSTISNFILQDGTFIPFNSSYIKNLATLPLFVDFNQEKCLTLAKEMGKLKPETLDAISEVYDISFTYDENMVKFLMIDKYYVYVSIDAIEYLDYYFQLVSSDKANTSNCIVIYNDYTVIADFVDCKSIEKSIVEKE